MECKSCKSCYKAGKRNHVKCLELLHKNGKYISEDVCRQVLLHNSTDCLIYIINSDCKYMLKNCNNYNKIHTFKQYSVECINILFNNGVINKEDYDMIMDTSYIPHIFK
jgi:hypothetical protein